MNLDIIHKYLNDEMTPQEFAAFEIRMLKEPELAEEVALQKEMKGFGKSYIKESLAKQHMRHVGDQFRPKAIHPNRRSTLKYLIPFSIAALFLVGLFTKQFLTPSKFTPDSLYQQYAAIPQLSFSTRSQNLEEYFLNAQSTFNNKQYLESLAFFKRILDANPSNAKALYYQAYAKIQSNNMNDGRSDLISLLDNPQYQNSALYHLGLSYIKTSEPEKAKEYFSRIPQSSNHYTDAQEILNVTTSNK